LQICPTPTSVFACDYPITQWMTKNIYDTT